MRYRANCHFVYRIKSIQKIPEISITRISGFLYYEVSSGISAKSGMCSLRRQLFLAETTVSGVVVFHRDVRISYLFLAVKSNPHEQTVAYDMQHARTVKKNCKTIKNMIHYVQ